MLEATTMNNNDPSNDRPLIDPSRAQSYESYGDPGPAEGAEGLFGSLDELAEPAPLEEAPKAPADDALEKFFGRPAEKKPAAKASQADSIDTSALDLDWGDRSPRRDDADLPAEPPKAVEASSAAAGLSRPEPTRRPRRNGPLACHNHVHITASWECSSCHCGFCSSCVQTREVAGHEVHECPLCSSICHARMLGDQLVTDQAFVQQIPQAFAFPLSGSGILMMGGATLLLSITSLLPGFFGLPIAFMIFGYYCAYLMKIIESTVGGSEKLPDWPDITEFGTDVLRPGLQVLFVFLVCLGPAIGYSFYYFDSGIIPLFLLVLGVLYLPMAMLATGVFRSYAAINPLLIVPAILAAPLDYLLAVVVLGVAVAASGASQLLVSLTNPFFGWLGATAISVYFVFVQMRLLGLLYRSNREKIGWFPDL